MNKQFTEPYHHAAPTECRSGPQARGDAHSTPDPDLPPPDQDVPPPSPLPDDVPPPANAPVQEPTQPAPPIKV